MDVQTRSLNLIRYCYNVGRLYACPPLLASTVVDLILNESPVVANRLPQILDFTRISVDSVRPTHFGFRVAGFDLTLREYAQRLKVEPFQLCNVVDSVEVDALNVWKCTPTEFYRNVIVHYNGSPGIWPDHESLKLRFFNEDLSNQLFYMGQVAEYFKYNPSPVVEGFLLENRTSLGIYTLKPSAERHTLGFEMSRSRFENVNKKCEMVFTAANELQTTIAIYNQNKTDNDQVHIQVDSIIQAVKSVITEVDRHECIDPDLWALQCHDQHWKAKLLGVLSAQPNFLEVLQYTQRLYKEPGSPAEATEEIRVPLRKVVISFLDLATEIEKLHRWAW